MAVVETYDPTGTLKPVAEGVWIVDGPVIRFGYLGLRFPFPTRMTVVRLADGGLWVHSPTELSSSLESEIKSLGSVKALDCPQPHPLLVAWRLGGGLSWRRDICRAWCAKAGWRQRPVCWLRCRFGAGRHLPVVRRD